MSRDEFTVCIASRDRTVSIYVSRQFASARWDWISITAEPMKFWISTINSLGSKWIIKMSLFFLYMSYERRYCNAKFKSGNLLLRNIVVIVIIIINVIVARSCVVQLQFFTQEALEITSEYMYISYIARSRDTFWSKVSKGENEIVWSHRAFSYSLHSNSHHSSICRYETVEILRISNDDDIDRRRNNVNEVLIVHLGSLAATLEAQVE